MDVFRDVTTSPAPTGFVGLLQNRVGRGQVEDVDLDLVSSQSAQVTRKFGGF